MGPPFFTADNDAAGKTVSAIIHPSRGPPFFTADNSCERERYVSDRGASMGPPFFTADNDAQLADYREACAQLQWGRRSSRRTTVLVGEVCLDLSKLQWGR